MNAIPLTPVQKRVLALRSIGNMTFQEIAQALGVSATYANQQFHRSLFLIRVEKETPFGGLSARARHVLECYAESFGWKTRRDVAKAILEGEVVLSKIRQCGQNTLREIETWIQEECSTWNNC